MQLRDSPAFLMTRKGNIRAAKRVKTSENTYLLVEEESTSIMPLLNLPEVEGLRLEEVVVEAQQICVMVAITVAQAPCPMCGIASPRVHSRYQRTVADLPWAGVTIRLLLHVRRFRCGNPVCPRVIFCERLFWTRLRWQALDLVFCGPTGGYRHQTKTRENFNRLLKKIGLPHMRVHDLRHNASTFLQMVLKMPAKMVQDILGHDDLEMMFDYTHSDLDTQRGMMDDLDRFFHDLDRE